MARRSYYDLMSEKRKIENELHDASKTVEFWMKQYEQVLKDAERYRWAKKYDPWTINTLARRWSKEARNLISSDPDMLIDVAMADTEALRTVQGNQTHEILCTG